VTGKRQERVALERNPKGAGEGCGTKHTTQQKEERESIVERSNRALCFSLPSLALLQNKRHPNNI
jgi:hypothetical protein